MSITLVTDRNKVTIHSILIIWFLITPNYTELMWAPKILKHNLLAVIEYSVNSKEVHGTFQSEKLEKKTGQSISGPC